MTQWIDAFDPDLWDIESGDWDGSSFHSVFFLPLELRWAGDLDISQLSGVALSITPGSFDIYTVEIEDGSGALIADFVSEEGSDPFTAELQFPAGDYGSIRIRVTGVSGCTSVSITDGEGGGISLQVPAPTDCCDECTTVLDMIKGSMRLASIIDATETPSDEDAQAALRSLNQLMGQWERDGIRLGWWQVCELEECLPIQEQDERAVRFNFAIELGVEYGVEPSPNVQRIAEETYAALCKQYQQVGELSVEHLPSSRLGGSIETG